MVIALALLLQAATPDAKSVADAVHAHFAAERWQEAVRAYWNMPEPPPQPKTDDLDAVRACQDYHRFRSGAHWDYAHCLGRLGRWEEALAAFQEARVRWRRPTFCGNAGAEFSVENSVAEGICLENLGRSREALDRYFAGLRPAGLCKVDVPAARIVELYSAAGAMADLEQRVKEADIAFRKYYEKEGTSSKVLDSIMRASPGAALQPYLDSARNAPGRWTRGRPKPTGHELTFPPIPKDFQLLTK